jgi:hypothetical protein
MEIKLGKLPAKDDKRTIKLSSILRKKLLPELPEAFSVDESVGGIKDDHMFANNQYGDCVIAARAHQTLRFEKYETGVQPEITDQEVIDEYLEQTGGADVGLYLLESLKDWKNDGWPVGGRDYTIYAFASVNWKNHDEVKHCIHLLGGVNFGMLVYQTDIDQFNAGKSWELTGYDGFLQGGHGVYLYEYDADGLTCMTWGVRQRMTWDFWDARIDEAYGIVDNRDDWVPNSALDVEKLDGYLAEITGDVEEEQSECPFANILVKGFNKASKLTGHKTRLPLPVIYRYKGGQR